MADVGVLYVLTTPGGTITFNSGIDPFDGTDKYYITEIRGLGMPSVRTPFDPVPLGDGVLLHNFWQGARNIGVEGTILVNSTSIEDDIVLVRNQMEADLSSALVSILQAAGTFDFTPSGQSLVSYTVQCEVPVDYQHASNYHSLDFGFGLIA